MSENEFFKYFKGLLKPPRREKPGIGRKIPDPVIRNAVTDVLKIEAPTTIIDYGCGRGRLVQALNLVNSKVLEHITYIGVDIDPKMLESTKQLAEKIKFSKKIRSFSVMTPEQLLNLTLRPNMVFLIDVLHEIHLVNLPATIYSLASKMKKGDTLIIHDLLQLYEGEKTLSAWYPESLNTLFRGLGFDVRSYAYETWRGFRVVAYVKMIKPEMCKMSTLLRLCIESYKISEQLLKSNIDKECGKTKRPHRLPYLYNAHTSITSQLMEFDKWLNGDFADKFSTSTVVQGLTNEIQNYFRTGIIYSLCQWLMKNRTSEGVWGYKRGRPARVLNTLEVLLGMLNVGFLNADNREFKKAINWIINTKCPDGGLPSLSFNKILGNKCASTTECTSWGVYFLKKASDIGFEIEQKIIDNAIDWIKSNFDEKKGGWGSWKGEPVRLYPTIWAVRALNKAHALDAEEYDRYLNRLLSLESELPGCFGFYPKSNATVSATALFLILISELPHKIKAKYSNKLDCRVKSAKEFIYRKRDKTSQLWIEEEEIRESYTMLNGFGEPLKTPFHHFSSAWALEALLRIKTKLSKNEVLTLYWAAAEFLHLARKGYMQTLSKYPHLNKANFLTALALTPLGLLRRAFHISDT